MVKLLAVSDIVMRQLEEPENLRRAYSDVDAVISCGDMPPPYLDLIASVIGRPLFYVRGNHDGYYAPGEPGGDDLHRRIVRFNGITLAGLEGSIRYNQAEEPQYHESEMHRMVLGLGPRFLLARARGWTPIDVLVTHSPPHGIHDKTDRAHRGFKSLLLAIRLYKPRYLIHGHVDIIDNRVQTVTDYEGCRVININPIKTLTIDPELRSG